MTDKYIDSPVNPKLKPAKNVRRITPRVCGACKFCLWQENTADCTRKGGPSFDTGLGEQWFYTCDRWEDEGM